MELSNLPLPTHHFGTLLHFQQSTGPSPCVGPFGHDAAATHWLRSKAFCSDLVHEYYSPLRILAPHRSKFRLSLISAPTSGWLQGQDHFPPFRLRVYLYPVHTFPSDNTRPPWVTHDSSPPCRPHTPWFDREEPCAFASIVQARPYPIFGRPVHLRDGSLDYNPVVLLKPFRSHLAMSTLPSRFFFPSNLAREALPPRLDIGPGPRTEWDFNPPETCAARHTLRTLPPPLRLSIHFPLLRL